MFPLVAAPSELAEALAMLGQEVDHAAHHGHEPPSSVRTGFMLETPAIAFSPDVCLEMVDFVSLGANDLMQYFFAADRENPRVADRYDPISASAIALLTSIREACDRHGKSINVCGELAGRPLEACVLAALGYRSLSMAAGSIGPVKRALAGCDLGLLASWLEAALARGDDAGGKGLRPAMLKAGADAGLPPECVDTFKSI
jgi:phosphotransferase system enzyme I (PtsP)